MITTIPSQTSEMTTVDALWVLIQSQTKAVRKALTERLLAEQDKTKVQKTMVRESLTRAFDEPIQVRYITMPVNSLPSKRNESIF